MNATRALAAEQAVALTAGVARDLIAQGPGKGLPKPRFLMAVFAFYAILGLVSAFGRGPARVAVAFGGVAALTTVVVGPGGIALAGLFDRLGGLTTSGTGEAPTGILGPTGSWAGSPPPGVQGPAVSPTAPPGLAGPTRNPPSGLRGPVGSSGRSFGLDAAAAGIFG